MKRAELGQVVSYAGRLHSVVAIGEGRTVLLRPADAKPCPHCGSSVDKHLLEHSPLFQDNVKPVKTVGFEPVEEGRGG